MNKELVLSRTEQGWMVEYRGPERAQIVKLFRTAILPTAFTARATWQVVQREVSRLNPDYVVVVR